LKKLRDDILALRLQRKTLTKDKIVIAKIDKVFE